jgi:CDP-paratose 2-epimerase
MRILITGGAGFIGSNIASHHISAGDHVIVFDNLSRKGAQDNIEWLKSHKGSFKFILGNIEKDIDIIRALFSDQFDIIYHFAAQVAVTLAIENPRLDFMVNALGALNLLEAARVADSKATIFYSSTNKVYGELSELETLQRGPRYEFTDLPWGISELHPLDFHSPYGCSKGAADQYFIDYARIYGLRTVVFRQSCIYGTRQIGIEDQGWISWFAIAARSQKVITIFGDGRQVRDVLYVDDLFEAFRLAHKNINVICGKVYNMGGGIDNTVSLLEVIKLLESNLSLKIKFRFDDFRKGDQKVFISDIRKAEKDFGWAPKINPKTGIQKMLSWMGSNS